MFGALSDDAVPSPAAPAAEADSDQDGCTDGPETGPNEESGGLRSPIYFWDFFDVWTHPAGQPTVWERNKVLNISDQGGADNWGEAKKLTHHEDAGGSDAGAAYVFRRDAGGANNWGEVKKLTASTAAP